MQRNKNSQSKCKVKKKDEKFKILPFIEHLESSESAEIKKTLKKKKKGVTMPVIFSLHYRTVDEEFRRFRPEIKRRLWTLFKKKIGKPLERRKVSLKNIY